MDTSALPPLRTSASVRVALCEDGLDRGIHLRFCQKIEQLWAVDPANKSRDVGKSVTHTLCNSALDHMCIMQI